MKYSGVKWIGDIPETWDVRKVKQCFYISKEPANQTNPVVLSLARSGVKVRDISNNEGQLAASYDNYNIVKPGDLLLNPMDLYSGANCNVSNIEGVISPAYINLRSKIRLDSKFYDYFFKTQYWTMAMFAHGKGVSFDNRWTINAESLLNYKIPFPCFHIQQQVSDLIKEKYKEIDDLISTEKKQIDLLKEHKDSMICDLLFGIKTGKEMKKTSNKFIPQIPIDWKFGMLKRVTKKITCGIAATPTYVPKEEGMLFLSAQNVQNNKIDLTVSRYIPFDLYKTITKNNKPEKGDLIQVRVGASIGKCAIVDIDDDFAVYVSLSLIKPNDKVVNKYLYYFLNTTLFRKMSEEFIDYLGSQGNLNVDDIKKIYLPIPPIEEQKHIVQQIDSFADNYDEIIELKNKKIETMEEYRKSLIFEYTTGKKEIKA